tara:strand:- start:1329 stop:1796 length:468 start_codon:yes stop_codon:yes gene_type:complete
MQPVESIKTAYDLIRNHYGESLYSDDIPDLVLFSDEADTVSGEYDDANEEISLNMYYCTTAEQCVKTLIHEYMHYLQPRNWYQRYYKMGHTHQTHPYEIQAEQVAERDWQRFTQPFYTFEWLTTRHNWDHPDSLNEIGELVDIEVTVNGTPVGQL